MSDARDDTRLRESFGQLRRALAPLAPDAARSVAAAALRARRRAALAPRLAWAGALAILTLASAWGAWRMARPAREELRSRHPAAAGREGLRRLPTDFLLEVPGGELLRTTPSLGTATLIFAPATPHGPVPGGRPIRRITS